MASYFRASKWDPVLIIAQITLLQSLCYILLSFILYIALSLLNGTELSLDLIFNGKEIRTDTGFGWSLIIVWLVNAFLSIPILMYIVQRAKLILDYVLTFHFLHLLLSWKISHFPTGISWWVLQIVAVAIMTFGGEWACMHREMKPIMISSGSNKNSSSNKTPSHNNKEVLNESSSSSNFIISEGDEEELIGNGNKRNSNISSKLKRKGSDSEHHDVIGHTTAENDQGALLSVVGKAKKALLLSTGKSKRSSKRYDQIPMTDIDSNNQ